MISSLIDFGKFVDVIYIINIVTYQDKITIKPMRKTRIVYFLTLFNKLYFRCSRYHLNALHNADALRLPYTHAYSILPIAAYHISLYIYGMPVQKSTFFACTHQMLVMFRPE